MGQRLRYWSPLCVWYDILGWMCVQTPPGAIRPAGHAATTCSCPRLLLRDLFLHPNSTRCYDLRSLVSSQIPTVQEKTEYSGENNLSCLSRYCLTAAQKK